MAVMAAQMTASAANEASPGVSAALSLKTGSVNVEDLVDYSKTVVVPTAYVKFLVEGSVFVSKSGSALQSLGGGSANTVNAGAAYTVQGIDADYARGIARQAYDDFVAKLRGAGYTVLTYDDIKDRDYVAGAARDTKPDAKWGLPLEKAVGAKESYIVAAPSAEQQFKIGFTGIFAEFTKYGKPKFQDATVIIPTYVINAPQAWGETGSGYKSIEAGVNVAPGMNLQTASATWMGKPKTRMMTGIPGVTLSEPVINISEKAGELAKVDKTSKGGNALSKGLSLLSGAGSISQNRAEYTYTIDREAYARGALAGIGGFNAETAKVAASAQP